MNLIVTILLLLAILVIWAFLMRIKSYKIRFTAGILFLGFITYSYNFCHMVIWHYETEYYDSAIIGIKELIEEEREIEVIEAISTYQKNRGKNYYDSAELASTISKLNWAEDDTDNPSNPRENRKNQLDN